MKQTRSQKKSLAALLLALLLAISLALPAAAQVNLPSASDSFLVNDMAGVLDQQAQDNINTYGRQLYDATGAQVVLVTVDFIGTEDIRSYATGLFNSWSIGDADKNNGVLILLSVGDNDYQVVTGTGLEQTLDSGTLGQILSETLEPFFDVGDYQNGALAIYGAIVRRLGGEFYGDTEPTPDEHLFVLDEAGVLSDVIVDQVNRMNRVQYAQNETGVYVVTFSGDPEDMGSLADYVFEEYSLEESTTLLLLYVGDTLDDNDYYIQPGYDVERLLSADPILDVFEDAFFAGDYDQAVLNMVGVTLPMMTGYRPPVAESSPAPSASVAPEPVPPAGNNDYYYDDYYYNPGPSFGSVIAGFIGMILILVVIVAIFSSLTRRRGGYGGNLYIMPGYRPRWYHRYYFWRPVHWRYPPGHRRYHAPPPRPPMRGPGGPKPPSGGGSARPGGSSGGSSGPMTGGGGSSRGSGAGRSTAKGFGGASSGSKSGGSFGGRNNSGGFGGGSGRSGGFGGSSGRSSGGFSSGGRSGGFGGGGGGRSGGFGGGGGGRGGGFGGRK